MQIECETICNIEQRSVDTENIGFDQRKCEHTEEALVVGVQIDSSPLYVDIACSSTLQLIEEHTCNIFEASCICLSF